MTDVSHYLTETESFDFRSEAVRNFCAKLPLHADKRAQAIAIYEAVRDASLYDPYHLDLNPSALKASVVATKRRAWCVEKAILAVACFRAFGFPARLGFGIVVNHLGAEKLIHYLKKNEIVFHGYVEVFIEDSWSKCTPAFDPRICALSGVEPLSWDTHTDSLFQAFKGEERFMEYVHFYGDFADVPYELMHAEMQKHYPHLFSDPIDTKAFSFQFDPSLIKQ
jgi:hypothetical protein